MYWLARKFKQPVYAWDERRRLADGRPDALDLVWYQPETASPKQAGWPLQRMFRGVEVGFLHSDWEDPNGVFFGFKGGDNKANHSHLDLGTFVLDAAGSAGRSTSARTTTTCRSTSATSAGPTTACARSRTTRC